MLIEEFKKNVTPITVPQVLSKLMNITNSLTLLMSSIKMNIMDNRINTPGFESINAMNLQSRKTAIDCLVSGLELFLQELQITTVGEYVPLPQKSEYNGANGSAADVSISNNSGIANDSEPEVVEIDSPTKMPKKLKMTKINDQIVVESDSDEDEIPVNKNVSQKVDVNKETNEKNSKTDEKNSKTDEKNYKTVDKEIKEKPTDKEIKEKPTEDKLSDDEGMEVENTISKDEEDTTSKDDENTTGKDEDQEKLDKNSKEKSPKKQLNTGTESPKKAKKSSDEKEETVDSENTEAQLELLKELADELIKNGKKTDSESEDGNTECEDEDDDSKCENKEQSDEEETENVVKKEKNDKRKSESSTVKKGKDSKKKNVKEDEKVQSESENEEEDNQNKPVTSASSNDESDSDSENSDESGPRRRLRKRKAKKEDERSEKKGKGSLKIRLRLPTRSKSQQKDEKKSERRSSRSKTAEESQDSDDKDSRSKGKDKKSKAKKKSVESESENFDSDLEDEIDKLAKDPKVQKKKKKSEKEEEEEEKSKKGNKKGMKEEKDKKSKGKKEEKGDSDSSEGTDNYDPEEAAEDEEEEEEPMDTVDPLPDLSDKENSSTEVESGDGDSDDSSDSEVIINSPKKKKGGKSGSKKAKKSESSDSDAPKKKKRLRTKLLDAKLSESDDSDFQVSKKGKGKKRKAKTDSSEEQESTEEDSDAPTKKKGRGKRSAVSKQKGKKGKQTKRRRIKVASESSDEKMSTEGEEELKNEKKKKKKKKKDSSSEDGSDEDEDGEGSPSKGRKKIRKIKSDKKLTDTTRKAVKAEEERRKRIAEKQKEFNNVVVEDDPSSPTKCPITKQLVLEYDKETKEPLIEVDKRLITKLKPHQVEAAQFMWDCTIESLERTKKEKGAGCILAHCMGLGKTLSVITFLHTVMNHSDLTGVTKALVVGPLNTVLNWQHEFETWLSGELGEEFYEVFEISSVKQNVARANMLKHWHKNGGVMIIGYEMFRNLTQGNHCRSKKLKQVFREALVDPGPDICVCDEGHILKNDASAISKAMNQIVTLKRIVLTGTPLQNNLIEYHCMVNFVKPNLLGTRKEFSNRFVNPIVNGQCTDSSSHDVRLMKRRAHIIHEKLAGCVQRKDYSALTKFLSPKYEYVISVRLSKVQIELYQKYLDKTGSGNDVMGKGAKLFSDYQALMRIWTHPWVLKMDEVRQEKKAKWDDEDSFVDDGSMSEDESVSEPSKCSSSESDVVAISDNSSDEDVGPRKRRNSREAGSSKDTDEVVVNSKGEVVKKWTTRSRGGEGTEWEGIIKAAEEEQEERPLTTDWWADYVTEEDATRIELSGKLSLLFEILRMSEEIGDKVLVFSQSLLSLDLIENFLEHIDKKHQEEMEEKEKKRKEEEEKNKEDGNDDKEKDKDDKEKDKDDKEKDKDDKEKDKEDKEEEKKDGEATPEENVFGKQWTKGADYFRMDGSTSAQHRKDLAASFNDPENYRARLFIISTKAGGLGINLVAANRVIIFDASWNPSNDVQSVFRVYRFGQNKPVYIYRFLAQGTMEEKIYERQVTKQSLSQRVVDEHQIERHFTSHDLQVLYTFKPDRLDDPNREERQTPELPKDHMLAEMLQSHKEWICCYHKHDSLLENQLNEELTEEERKAAWKEFEEEKQGIANNVRQQFMGMNNFQGMAGAMGPNINMNMLMQQGLRLPAMGGMPGSNMPFNQQNLLQLVQDMKTRFPNLPEDQLTARVQGVIRHIITSQYMQQQEMQKRQLEQREMQHQQQLHQIQAQIQRQQQQLNAHQRMGSNFGQLPNNRR